MLGSRDAQAGQAGRPRVFVELLDDVKDQGIGLLHVVPGFLQHVVDYSTPAQAAGLSPAAPGSCPSSLCHCERSEAISHETDEIATLPMVARNGCNSHGLLIFC